MSLEDIIDVLQASTRFVVYDDDTGLHTDQLVACNVWIREPKDDATAFQLRTLLGKRVVNVMPVSSQGTTEAVLYVHVTEKL